ncbi:MULTISPECIES: hypothetical protein [Bradyrhizobium]|uniref:hypothetical protein n=1 Tax=Bradyrhizobium TaxID=374 RepID=UPI002304FAA9|nr:MULTISPECIES: hypothetical protein [unclassified Bradyrhizobium]
MLPGFRFLFAAILLSVSILVFGLGAAALLRASHEQYVSNPSWRNGPQEQVFAQAPEPAQPVLAVLRAEPEPTAEPEPSLRDKVPTIGLPESESDQVAVLTTETEAQSQVAAPPADVPVAEPAKAETTKTETTKAETTTEAAAPAPADTLTPADTTASIPAAEPAATASEPAPVDPSAALASSARDAASAKLAALNEPATTAVKDAPAKAKTESKADDKAAKRKAKVKKRHRVVRRPPPQQLQQQLDPFGQPQTFATTTTRTR